MDNPQYDNTEKLLRYFDKEMTNDEQLAFESELAVSKTLQDELANLQLAKTAIRTYGIQQQVARIHREEKTNIVKQAPVVNMNATRKWIMYAAAAASVILIFIAINRYTHTASSADNLYAEQFSRFEPSASRGTVTTTSAVEKAYEAKDHQKVIELYKNAQPASPKEMIIAADAYLETNQPAAAIMVLNALLEQNRLNGSATYNDDASYYLALAYLKNKDIPAAVIMMEKIHNDTGNMYSNKFSTPYIERVKRLGTTR